MNQVSAMPCLEHRGGHKENYGIPFCNVFHVHGLLDILLLSLIPSKFSYDLFMCIVRVSVLKGRNGVVPSAEILQYTV